jgi:hypothetical protein
LEAFFFRFRTSLLVVATGVSFRTSLLVVATGVSSNLDERPMI